MPGASKLKGMMAGANIDDGVLKRQEAIILSMTKAERAKPEILNASRRKRIAAGSGVQVHDVNKLIKQFQDLETMMKRMQKNGGKDMMRQMGGLFGGNDMQEMAKKLESSGMIDNNILGPNPFIDKK